MASFLFVRRRLFESFFERLSLACVDANLKKSQSMTDGVSFGLELFMIIILA